MKKRICFMLAFLLAGTLFAGCQSPRLLTDFLLEDFYAEELNYPLVLRSMEGAEIPCLLQKRKSFMDFPARNMAMLMFPVTKEEPYWAIAVRNQGPTALKVQIGKNEVTVSPGSSNWIYQSEAAAEGECNVIFRTHKDELLSGSVELWQAQDLSDLKPMYRMTAKILKVLDGYFLAEPIRTSDREEAAVKFYGATPILAGEEYSLREGSIVEIGYSGPFSSSSPYYLDGIRSVKILSSASVEK